MGGEGQSKEQTISRLICNEMLYNQGGVPSYRELPLKARLCRDHFPCCFSHMLTPSQTPTDFTSPAGGGRNNALSGRPGGVLAWGSSEILGVHFKVRLDMGKGVSGFGVQAAAPSLLQSL